MSVKELFVTKFIHYHIDKESKYIPGKKIYLLAYNIINKNILCHVQFLRK